ncbi:hypothetical protein KAT08_02495 [Candidatus Babeliales bacterium]|nr:hypothetical protein [Candidatus Babeliales bacterium]
MCFASLTFIIKHLVFIQNQMEENEKAKSEKIKKHPKPLAIPKHNKSDSGVKNKIQVW